MITRDASRLHIDSQYPTLWFVFMSSFQLLVGLTMAARDKRKLWLSGWGFVRIESFPGTGRPVAVVLPGL